MSNIAQLHHIFGNYKDKLLTLPTAEQPILTDLINDLSQVPYHSYDGLNPLQAIDLWEAALTNPNLTIDNFKVLFPLVFRMENYSVRQHHPLILDSRTLSEQICNNLVKLNFSDELYLELFSNLINDFSNWTKPTRLLNKRTADLLKKLILFPLPKLHAFLQTHKESKLAAIPPAELLRCTRASFRSHYFDSLLVFNVTNSDIKGEIKRRKISTPKSWKNYTTQDFLSFFTNLQSLVQTTKLGRRDFFKILKNRLWSREDLVTENEKYLEELDKISQLINEQKQAVTERIQKLKADSTPKTD